MSTDLSDPPEVGRASSWITKGLALFFAAYGVFSLWTLFYRVTPAAVVAGSICGAVAVGLWLERPWSRWIVYFISSGLGLWFVWYVWRLVQGGWPYEDGTRSLMSVLPASVLLLLGIGAAIHVRRVFRKS